MQEKMTGKAIALVLQGAEGGIDLLKKAIEVFLEIERQRAKGNTNGKAFKNPFTNSTIKHGQQSVKDLENKGKGWKTLKSIRIISACLLPRLGKYGVDFAITKNKNTDPLTHTVFFKGKDTGSITSAFKDFVGREEHLVKRRINKVYVKLLKK